MQCQLFSIEKILATSLSVGERDKMKNKLFQTEVEMRCCSNRQHKNMGKKRTANKNINLKMRIYPLIDT